MIESAGVGRFAGDLLSSAGLIACPDCPTARIVQASVLDERFWPHLLVTLLPLLVLAAIVAGIHGAAARRGRGAARSGRRSPPREGGEQQ